MTAGRRAVLALAVALLGSGALNLVLLRRPAPGATVAPVTPPAPPTNQARAAVTVDAAPSPAPAPCPPVAVPGRTAAPTPIRAARADDPLAGFKTEPRDDAWAAPQEAMVHDRLVLMRGVLPNGTTVECRQACCRLTTPTTFVGRVDLLRDLQSSVGFRDLPCDQMAFTSADPDLPDTDVALLCFDRSRDTLAAPVPDRAVERRDLLARAAPALANCVRQGDVPAEVGLAWFLSETGAVVGATRDGEVAGTDAARCAERVLLQAARFAPAPRPTYVPLTVALAPPPP